MKLIRMNRTLFSGLIYIMFFIGCEREHRQEQPNILFIMSDDHAVQAISAYGHPLSKIAPTPNIDRLAEQGAIFTANYCGNSICGPSRATILTGKHSHKHGFMRNTAQGFDGSQQTLPKLLQENDYETAIIGKWHLVSEPTGFNFWQILIDQGEYNNPDFISRGDTIRHEGYATDIITDLTIEWLINRNKSKPFFLMMHHKAPHRNWMPAPRHYNAFADAEFPVPENYFDDYRGRQAAAQQEMNIYRDMYEGHDLKMVEDEGGRTLRYDPWPHVWIERMTEAQLKEFWDAFQPKADSFFKINPKDDKAIALWKLQRYLEDYLATIKSVDESVGQILDYLDKTGLAENTIVVYTSDQGFYLGEHGWFDKRFMYEESMLMPLLMRYPGYIEPGTVIDKLTQNIDYAPTFLDFAGMETPNDMQGVSIRNLLKEEIPMKWRNSLYYHFYEYPGFHSVRKHYGVRTHQHKLIHFYEDNNWELFDLEADPLEMNNIYGREGTEGTIKELEQELRRLQTIYEVPEEHIK
jgi:arylsulfatase A-like enzyme